MADVIETPQTVPSERIKYTVDAETAWSQSNLAGAIYCE